MSPIPMEDCGGRLRARLDIAPQTKLRADRVLDDIGPDRHLLHPAGRQLQQLGEDELRLAPRHPDGEPDHLGPPLLPGR